MISHLRGRLLEKEPQRILLEAAGVGYEVAVSVATFSALPAQGSEASVHIHTHVREDALLLYGFFARAEKQLFEKLIGISGVGPKLALTILSGLSAEQLVAAIRSSDHAMLTRIPGVGKKTAERVTLELKDKLEAFASAPAAIGSVGAIGDDVRSALENLGYPRPAAEKAIEKAVAEHPSASKEFETLFRAAMAVIR